MTDNPRSHTRLSGNHRYRFSSNLDHEIRVFSAPSLGGVSDFGPWGEDPGGVHDGRPQPLHPGVPTGQRAGGSGARGDLYQRLSAEEAHQEYERDLRGSD